MTGAGWGDRLRHWARVMKRDVIALWVAARDPRTPPAAKIVAAVVAAYALSPVDLIPDFIPVLGYLDDAILVPLGILLAVRLIPAALFAEFRAEATKIAGRPASPAGLIMIVMLWISASVALLWLAWPDVVR